MKVSNIHLREINQTKSALVDLFSSLATKEDKIWPTKKWPRMHFKEGLKIGAEGGHGPIRYKVLRYDPMSIVEFQFQKPKGFNGIHKLELISQAENRTQVKHSIEMETEGIGTLTWLLE